MGTVYVREQGAVVHRDGERLRVTREKEELTAIPLVHLDQLALMGNVQLTTPAAALLLDRGVDVIYMSMYGKFRGRLIRSESRQAQLRHQQMRVAGEEKAALTIARAIVRAKVNNQRVVLQRRAERVHDAQRALQGMMAMGREAERALSLDSLRGYEGKAGAFYFEALRALLPQDWGFEKRQYHPPPDPANALLSFGYTLLLKDVTAAIQIVGLDPYIGFFHVLGYDRPALALDLMEELRPAIVDSMFLDIVANRRLDPQSFQRSNNPRQPCLLGEQGVCTVLEAYEQRLQGDVFHPLARGQTTYRRAIELQVRQLARVIQGEDAAYQPLTIK
ncbi:MAG: CRISPR-associated endonuclease Cas1 [Anaerolineae bacterium]|nr:CRISPR-associated endonuclease Cas1 [Anaerolineae bacterium]